MENREYIYLSEIIKELYNKHIKKLNEEEISQLDRIPSTIAFEIFVTRFLKHPNGPTSLKAEFNKIKAAYLSNISPGLLKSQIQSFFKLIKLFENVPELREEYELYSFWGNLYEKTENSDIISNHNDAPFVRLNRDLVFSKAMLSRYSEEMKIIMQHLAKDNDIEVCGAGCMSVVFSAGDKVVKLGDKVKFKVPYHPRIMMPYFRQEYETGVICEVFNFANVQEARNISDEQLLEIYKELEAAGIFWGDAKKDNLGILLKDNVLPDYIASEDFNVFGFSNDSNFPTTNHTVLPAGTIVIIDLDLIYALNDPSRKEVNSAPIIKEYLRNKKEREKANDELGV